jgi:nucleoside-diphosphate-sugar epimerase
MSSNVPVQDYRKIVVFGATGTIGKAVVAGLSPKYEILKVGNRQGQFKADLADAHSIRNVFIYHIEDISRDEPFTVTVKGKPFAVVPYTIHAQRRDC